jgi:hypothetical protein
MLLGTQAAPNSISILGISLNVLVVRIISVYLFLGAMAAFYFVYRKTQKNSNIKQMNREEYADVEKTGPPGVD